MHFLYYILIKSQADRNLPIYAMKMQSVFFQKGKTTLNRLQCRDTNALSLWNSFPFLVRCD